jgi:hypothetical protein
LKCLFELTDRTAEVASDMTKVVAPQQTLTSERESLQPHSRSKLVETLI